MNWQEYILNIGNGEEIELSDYYNPKEDIINNWQIYILKLIHDKENEKGIMLDEGECLERIKYSLMDCNDKLDILSLQLDAIIDGTLND